MILMLALFTIYRSEPLFCASIVTSPLLPVKKINVMSFLVFLRNLQEINPGSRGYLNS